MKRAIIFGTGAAAFNVYYSLNREDYEIIGFMDNDAIRLNEFSQRYHLPVLEISGIRFAEADLVIIAVVTLESVARIKKQIVGLLDGIEGSQPDILTYQEYTQVKFRMDLRTSILHMMKDEIEKNHIQGSVAEVGVYKGDFARCINDCFPNRKLYLFDTFDGFDNRDTEPGIKTIASEFSDTSIAEVLNKMPYKEQCIVKKGYFPETASGIQDTFCLVSLDADLYNPIYQGLAFFYPLLVRGGYIIIHDYNNPRFPGAKRAVEEFCSGQGIGCVPICDDGMSAIIAKG